MVQIVELIYNIVMGFCYLFYGVLFLGLVWFFGCVVMNLIDEWLMSRY